MAAMVFLRSAADMALFFMVLGPAAVHFGARPLFCAITSAAICAAQVMSFVIEKKKPKLRLLPYLLPLLCILLPGRCISWAVLGALMLAYEVFTGATRRYMPESTSQKTILKITAGLIVLMLLLLLVVSARSVSFTIVMLSGLISAACSILILRSLRHEPEVYSRASFQAVNLAAIAAVGVLSAILGSGPVIKGLGITLKTIYTGIAYAFLFLFNYVIRFFAWLYRAVKSLFSGNISPPVQQPPLQLENVSAEDIFPVVEEYTGLPLWLKIIGAVIIAAVLLLVIILVFRKLAGRRAEAFQADPASSSYTSFSAGEEKRRFSGQVQGVRKQYRKYLGMIEKEGLEIGADDTSEDIFEKAPGVLGSEAARELRDLYIDARYNGTADKAAAERARELIREIRKEKSAGSV